MTIIYMTEEEAIKEANEWAESIINGFDRDAVMSAMQININYSVTNGGPTYFGYDPTGDDSCPCNSQDDCASCSC